jgi:bisphosphoglycerate-independent phosphoglycerate mutase (AlkP superfamily)
VTAADAGKKFAQLGRSLDFTLFEYFVTDPAGHQRDMEKSIAALETMDAFVGGILQSFDHDKDVLLIVSDHGNIEDLSMKTHTRNRVPLIVVGRSRHFFTSRISRLDHVTPAVVHFLTMR